MGRKVKEMCVCVIASSVFVWCVGPGWSECDPVWWSVCDELAGVMSHLVGPGATRQPTETARTGK